MGGGRLREADELLTTRLKSRPVSGDEFSCWIIVAAMRGAYDEAQRRLRVAQGVLRNIDWLPLEAEVLVMAREYGKAVALVAAAQGARRDPAATAGLAEIAAESRIMKRLADDMAGRDKPGGASDFGVYAINLDENPDRWQRLSAQIGSQRLRRVPGVPGRYLPDGVIPRFGRNVSAKMKGTLGCFLAHYAAWEAVAGAAEGQGLILEDDCMPRIAIPNHSDAFLLPPGYDICLFTSGLARLHPPEGEAAPLSHRPVSRLLTNVPLWFRTPGAYGYMLSRAAAQALIARVDEDGFYGDVDFRLLAYCITPETVAQLSADGFCRVALDAHFQVLKDRPPLAGYASYPGLIAPGRIGSVREQSNRAPHAHLAMDKAAP